MPEADLDKITLLNRRQVAEALGRSAETLDQWCKDGSFPKPIQARPGAPKQWQMSVVVAWLEKRKRSRYVPPAKRGSLMRGNQLKKQGASDEQIREKH